jgi:hypothetical protein
MGASLFSFSCVMAPRKLTVNKGHKENTSFVCIFSRNLKEAMLGCGMASVVSVPGCCTAAPVQIPPACTLPLVQPRKNPGAGKRRCRFFPAQQQACQPVTKNEYCINTVDRKLQNK